jgi:uracil-DNA glycosylase
MDLFEAASVCRECPGVVAGSAVLGMGNGPIPCDVLFIGEAPGRLGAGRTGVPFSGDESGRRFETLLAASGLDRNQVFVTNALLCLPLDAAGRNRRPRMDELSRCSRHLAATLEAVDPAVVVTLGAVALASLERIEAHGLSLNGHVALAAPWAGRTLVPLYHPGRQAQLHRSWALQLGDWKLLARTVSNATEATHREASDRQAP